MCLAWESGANRVRCCPELFERVADQYFAYLTTTGRRSGKAHTIEIWFGLRDGRVYMLSGGGDRLIDG